MQIAMVGGGVNIPKLPPTHHKVLFSFYSVESAHCIKLCHTDITVGTLTLQL